jgi:hypothetical protein
MLYMCCQHVHGQYAGGGVRVAVLAEWGDRSATNGEQRSSGGLVSKRMKQRGGGGEAHQVSLYILLAT